MNKNEQVQSKPTAIVPKELARNNGQTRAIPCGSPGTQDKTSVELLREGDRIVGIIFRCACGNPTTVSCEYE